MTLNYRLGYYGFLTSRELKMEAEANNQEYYPNLGLYDQRLALQWVGCFPRTMMALLIHELRFKTTFHTLGETLRRLPLQVNLPAHGQH